jgi:hypothetical protein
MTKEDELTAGLRAELARVDARLAQVTRPQNCGTGYCSCVECVVEPAPVQEPVAWGIIASNTGRICQVELDADEVEGHNPKHIVPLYTAPQPVPVKTYHDGKPWPVAPSDLNPEHIIRQLVTALENSGTKMRSDQWYLEIEAVAAGKRYLAEMALLGREKMDEEHRVGFDGPDED